MLYIIYAVHVVICLFLIMVVLLQQGSGADLSVFGGGGTQTAFGARSATNLLHKLTVAGFVGFILTTIAFGFLKSGGPGGSVMSGVEQTAPAQAEPQETAVETTPPVDEVEATPVDETNLDAAAEGGDSQEPSAPERPDGP
jgi:preprotein translocase subunit SecG